MSDRERLIERFEDLKRKGLTDIKFFMGGADGWAPDEAFAAANSFMEATERGQARRHERWEEDLIQRDVNDFF